MLSYKKLTCKGTLRQVFIRVYILEIQPVMFVFSTQFFELLSLSPPSPPSLGEKYTVYMCTVCKGGGGGYGPQSKNSIRSIVTAVLKALS
jgi:hypothetical protein